MVERSPPLSAMPSAIPSATVLAAAGRAQRPALTVAFLFSAFVNLLMLAAPLYMLQVYDRVLTARSQETLVVLTLLVAFLFVVMGVLDHARARILARIGARLRAGLDRQVHAAALHRWAHGSPEPGSPSAQRDLDAVARLWASPVLLAGLDAPWTPLFLGALFVFHPLLGWLAVAGGLILVAVAAIAQGRTAAPLHAATEAQAAAEREGQVHRAEAEVLMAMGLAGAAQDRQQHWRDQALAAGLLAADRAGGWASLSRAFRLFLQSAMLGAGAWLVLQDQLTAGAMIAASVLMGRALQPVEQAIGHWPTVIEARQAAVRLRRVLTAPPQGLSRCPYPGPPRLALPPPAARLEARGLVLAPPGSTVPVLRGVSFDLHPGQALGVIGPSGAGKSALARALTGLWPVAAGQLRLDGAELSQYPVQTLGAAIGYLPQRVGLFDGTVAENIARLAPVPPPDLVIAAAMAAAAHPMILRLPGGYDAKVAAPGVGLSGGQVQRIGLARALFGAPALLILDEPNAHLDNDGIQALNAAVQQAKARGAAVVLMAHRPTALQHCDLLLVLRDGQVVDFGPRDRVLRDQVRNAGDIAQALGPGEASAVAQPSRARGQAAGG